MRGAALTFMTELGGVGTGAHYGEVGRGEEGAGVGFGRHLGEQCSLHTAEVEGGKNPRSSLEDCVEMAPRSSLVVWLALVA